MTSATLRGLVFCAMAAAGAAQAASLAHDYTLNGTLADAYAGPTLNAFGGSLDATHYRFQPNQGLLLTNGFADPGDYSIELQFSFASVSGYRRVIEFKDLSSDAGVYVLNGGLNFYPVTTGVSEIVPNVEVNVILTRDAASQQIVGYVNGVQRIALADSLGRGVFSAPSQMAWFFRDDNAVGGEASAGSANWLRIYDGAMTATQAACLQGSNPFACGLGGTPPIPEPGTWALLGAGLLGIGAVVRRRRGAVG